jgi:hypothetical protein
LRSAAAWQDEVKRKTVQLEQKVLAKAHTSQPKS